MYPISPLNTKHNAPKYDMIGPKIKNVTNINSKRYLPIASLSFGVLSFSFSPKSYPIAQQAVQYNIKNIIKIIKSAITYRLACHYRADLSHSPAKRKPKDITTQELSQKLNRS